MCTAVIVRAPQSAWPLILLGNRDEDLARPWLPPGRHWHHLPNILAGLDVAAGGSWFGINGQNMAAMLLNREGTVIDAGAGELSRGDLVLVALRGQSPECGVDAVRRLELRRYRPFNLIVADADGALLLSHRGAEGATIVEEIPIGVSMITLGDINSPDSSRIRTYRAGFGDCLAARPELDDWGGAERLLRQGPTGAVPHEAMCYRTPGGFGTVSSSLLALPARRFEPRHPIWKFAAGPPDMVPWEEVGEGWALQRSPEGEPQWARVIRQSLKPTSDRLSGCGAALAVVGLVIIERPQGLFLVLTERSRTLRRNPGDVCLPGGMLEDGDGSITAAFLREASEEIGLVLRPDDILGTLPPFVTADHLTICPVVAWTRTPPDEFARNSAEVADVFEVPLGDLLPESRYHCVTEMTATGLRRYCETAIAGRRVWGITGTILAELSACLCRVHGLIEGLALARTRGLAALAPGDGAKEGSCDGESG